MAPMIIEPDKLAKKLVGETLEIRVTLNPLYNYEVFIEGTINRTLEPIPAFKDKSDYVSNIPLRQSGFFTFSVRYRRDNAKTWKRLKDKHNRLIKVPVQVDPAWLAHAIIYCVFVRFFKGRIREGETERSPAALSINENQDALKSKNINFEKTILPGEGGTFDDVKVHLDELKKMHVNVLYFNPIHTIGELYRGYNMLDQLPPYLQPGSPYSVKDYKAIDPELGYDKDSRNHLLTDPQQEFLDLVKAAHEKGMFVIMDLVFNHTAHDFVFQRIHPEWYLYKEHVNSLTDNYLYPEDIQRGLPWGDPRHSMAPYDHGVFWEDCAQLNWEHSLPDGPNDPPPNFSLPKMWEFFKSIPQYWIAKYGVDGFRADVAYRIPQTFWKGCIAEAREYARKVKTNLSYDVVFIAESYTNDLESLQNAGFSAVYGDFSHKLNRPIELKGYCDYIYNLSGNYFPKGSKWLLFPDSHDFDRTPRKVLPSPSITTERALRANRSRWVLTATLPGIPLIFNGFEKIEWQPINIWSYGAINWQKEADLQDFIAKVNDVRRHSPALERGSYQYLFTKQGLDEESKLFTFLRTYKEEIMLIAVNMDVINSVGPIEVSLPEVFVKPYILEDLLTGESFKRSGENLPIILGPGQSHIFKVKFEDQN